MSASKLAQFKWLAGYAVLLSTAWFAAAGVADESPEPAGKVYAVVDETELLWSEYQQEYRREMRSRFYHGSVPETERQSFGQQVADTLIEEVLLADEARVRGLMPDRQWVEESRDLIDRSNRQNPQWADLKGFWLPRIEARLERQSLVARLEAQVKAVPEASLDEVQAFYRQNPDKFTQPAQNRVSLILIGVPPSAPNAEWQTAEAEVRQLREQLNQGADFGELALVHSTDPSADDNGDMGYIHDGMLGETAQAAIDALQPGEVTEPVWLLDGVALFRLTDRKPPQLQPFELVHERARDLHRRGAVELAWKSLIFRLRQGADIRIEQPPPELSMQ